MIKDKLKYNSLLKIGSGLYRLTGKTGDRYVVVCANQWHIENKYVKYIKIIEKYLRYDENFRKSLEEKDGKIVISPASNEEQKELFVSREKTPNSMT